MRTGNIQRAKYSTKNYMHSEPITVTNLTITAVKNVLTLNGRHWGGFEMTPEHFELLLDLGKQRIYKCDELLRLGMPGGNPEPLAIRKDFDKFTKRPTRYFMVSDAMEHTERLVFPFYPYDDCMDDDIREFTTAQPRLLGMRGEFCAGETTMLIYGGDPATIRPDEEYLAELWDLNHVKEIGDENDEIQGGEAI